MGQYVYHTSTLGMRIRRDQCRSGGISEAKTSRRLGMLKVECLFLSDENKTKVKERVKEKERERERLCVHPNIFLNVLQISIIDTFVYSAYLW